VVVVVYETTLPPVWAIIPTDQIVEYGMSLDYQILVADASGIASWTFNDSTNFALSATYYFGGSTARITSVGALAIGAYGLSVTAFDTYGNTVTASLTVTVQDTTPPAWATLPIDQVLNYEEALNYQLQATDLSGINQWTVNDTTNFDITNTGTLTNKVTLASGEYRVLVTVGDPYANLLTATFTITVGAAPPPPPPPPPTTTLPPTSPTTPPGKSTTISTSTGFGLGPFLLVGLVGIVYSYYRRRKTS
jgi:hypothetical protein